MAEGGNDSNDFDQNVEQTEMDMLSEMEEMEELFHGAEAATAKAVNSLEIFLMTRTIRSLIVKKTMTCKAVLMVARLRPCRIKMQLKQHQM